MLGRRLGGRPHAPAQRAEEGHSCRPHGGQDPSQDSEEEDVRPPHHRRRVAPGDVEPVGPPRREPHQRVHRPLVGCLPDAAPLRQQQRLPQDGVVSSRQHRLGDDREAGGSDGQGSQRHQVDVEAADDQGLLRRLPLPLLQRPVEGPRRAPDRQPAPGPAPQLPQAQGQLHQLDGAGDDHAHRHAQHRVQVHLPDQRAPLHRRAVALALHDPPVEGPQRQSHQRQGHPHGQVRLGAVYDAAAEYGLDGIVDNQDDAVAGHHQRREGDGVEIDAPGRAHAGVRWPESALPAPVPHRHVHCHSRRDRHGHHRHHHVRRQLTPPGATDPPSYDGPSMGSLSGSSGA